MNPGGEVSDRPHEVKTVFIIISRCCLFHWTAFYTKHAREQMGKTMGSLAQIKVVLTMLLLLSLQSCPTLCDPRDGCPPGSAVPGILQARTLEWVAISFSNASKRKVKVKSLSRVRLFETTWTAAYQAPRPMGFARQEYWSGVPLPSPVVTIDFH